jgi:hypothetical protein
MAVSSFKHELIVMDRENCGMGKKSSYDVEPWAKEVRALPRLEEASTLFKTCVQFFVVLHA